MHLLPYKDLTLVFAIINQRMSSSNEDSFFSCLACFGREEEGQLDKGKEVVFLDQYRSSQLKASLKVPIAATTKLVSRQSDKALAKSGVNRCSLRKKSTQFNNDADLLPPEKPQITSMPTNTSIPVSSHHRAASSRLLESQTLVQPAAPIQKVPKIKFIYNDRPLQPNVFTKQSQIHIEGDFQLLPEIEFTNKISEINKRSLPSQPMRASDIPDQPSPHSSTSPINALFRATNKDIVVSKDLGQKSNNNSFQSSKRLKRLPSYNDTFGKGKMRVRQTESIRQPEDESEAYSVVISNSFIVKPGGLLLPIDENEFQTKLSEFKE